LYICSILCVTKNPPKILMAARVTATNPSMFEKDILLPSKEAKDAMIAPTIITEEIALVTDIKGVWRDGVTFQTTKYPINIERIKMLSLNIKGSISMILFFN
jgi:hypothetical protein